jgi:hypothetical protein
MNDCTSIIITTYNRPHWLGKAIESCLRQVHRPIEIVVVDDGSKKDTAREIAWKYPNVIYHYQKNLGLGGARNTGLEICNGDFIQFLDDDDWLDTFCISKKTECLFQKPKCGAVYSDLFITDAQETILGRYYANNKRPMPEGAIFVDLLTKNFIPVHSLLWRKSVLEEVGGFPIRSGAEDWEILVKAAQITEFAFVDEPLGYYRLHQTNMSLNYPQQMQGDTKVQHVIVKSPMFKNLPKAVQIGSLVSYSRKQWLWGDKQEAIQFRELARGIQPNNTRIVLLYLFMLMGKGLGRFMIRLFWKVRSVLSKPSTTSYFLNRLKIL